MKCAILAGGRGTRIAEETAVRPKPLIEVDGKPLLWHIMSTFSAYGINEFVICLVYKGYLIGEYFANYYIYNSDLTVDLYHNTLQVHSTATEPWTVTLVDTREETLTGGHLKRVQRYPAGERFCFTYGDGLTAVDVSALLSHHERSGKLATVTAVQAPGSFGSVVVGDRDNVLRFQEKPLGDNSWISGGSFVLEPEIFGYLDGDTTSFDGSPLECLAAEDNLSTFRHHGFWHAVGTLRDKMLLESLWATGAAPRRGRLWSLR